MGVPPPALAGFPLTVSLCAANAVTSVVLVLTLLTNAERSIGMVVGCIHLGLTLATLFAIGVQIDEIRIELISMSHVFQSYAKTVDDVFTGPEFVNPDMPDNPFESETESEDLEPEDAAAPDAPEAPEAAHSESETDGSPPAPPAPPAPLAPPARGRAGSSTSEVRRSELNLLGHGL